MQPSLPISVLDRMLGSIQAIPASIHLPAAVALLAGVLLLLAGGKILRPVFILVGCAIGGLIGALLLPNFIPDSVFGAPSPVVGLGAGALLGGVVALSVFRIAMGISAAASMGALAVLSAGVYLAATPGALPPAPTTEKLNAAWQEGAKDAATTLARDRTSRLAARVNGVTGKPDASTPAGKDDDKALETAAATTRAFVDSIFAEAHAYWDRLPGDSRITLGAALIGGAMLGFVLGTVAPKKGAAIVTSLLGAGLVVASVAWLMHGFDVPGRSLFDRGVHMWLAAWLLPALAGVVFQLSRNDKRGAAPRPAPAPAA